MNKIITVTKLLTFARKSSRMIYEEKKKKNLSKNSFTKGTETKRKERRERNR